MPVRLGNTPVLNYRLGATPVAKAYLGATVVFASPPTPPLNLVATKSGSDVLLDWDPPATDYGVPVTDYVIEYAPLTFLDDDFNRADNTDIGANWSPRNSSTPAGTRCGIVGNKVVPSAASGTPCIEDYVTDLTADNIYAELTVVWGAATFIGLLCRGLRDGNRNEVGFEINSDRQYDLAEFINGSHISRSLSAINAVPVGTAVRIRGELNGANARYYVNESLMLEATLTTRLTGGRIGFGCSDQTASVTTSFDNFQCGRLTPSTWTTYADTTSEVSAATVTGLPNGEYYFRVSAVNAGGTSSPSGISNRIKIGGDLPTVTVPAAPAAPTGTPGNTQVSLLWSAPSDGGASINDFVVQYAPSPPGTSWTTFPEGASTATNAIVTGLTNAQNYVFRVAAVNSVGQGAYSAASVPIMPYAPGLPPAPTDLVVSAGDALVSLSWTPSAPTSGPITDYVIQYAVSPPGTSWTTFTEAVSTVNSTVVTGLTNGTTYVMRVAAVNATGQGSYSSASAPVTPASGAGAAEDDFNRANGALGSNWTNVRGGWVITSNQATCDGQSFQQSFWAADMVSTNHFIEVDWNSASGDINLHIAADGTGASGYRLVMFSWASAYCEIKMSNGADTGGTTLATAGSALPGWGGWVRLRFQKVGSEIKGFVGSTEVISYTAPTPLTGLRVGIGAGGYFGSSLTVDNFEAG